MTLVLIGSGCSLSRTGDTSAAAESSTGPQGGPATTSGQPLADVLAALDREGLACGRVDDNPVLVWNCFAESNRMTVRLDLLSEDRDRISMFTLVVSNSLSVSTHQDPMPLLEKTAKVLVPASYHGPERDTILDWLSTDAEEDLSERFGPVAASLMGNEQFANFSMAMHDFAASQAPSADYFETFHVTDAWEWGRQNQLRCSQGGLVGPGIFERVRCVRPDGPRAGVDFSIATDDDESTPGIEYSKTVLEAMTVRFVPKEEGSKEAAVEIAASLVRYLSGSDKDAERAHEWALRYADAKVDSELGVFNGLLHVSPEGYKHEDLDASFHIWPTGYIAS